MASGPMKAVFDSYLLTELIKATVWLLMLKLGNVYFMQYKYVTHRHFLFCHMRKLALQFPIDFLKHFKISCLNTNFFFVRLL